MLLSQCVKRGWIEQSAEIVLRSQFHQLSKHAILIVKREKNKCPVVQNY